MTGLTAEEGTRRFNQWQATKAARIQRYQTTKPSPKAYSIGDEVIVTYPPSRYFKQKGVVRDLEYLPSSASKGYGDYTVIVDFPEGATRRFLVGRVAPSDYLDSKKNLAWINKRAKDYNKRAKDYKTRITSKKELHERLSIFEKEFGPRSTWDPIIGSLIWELRTPEELKAHPKYKLVQRCKEEGIPPHIIFRLTKGIEELE